MVSTDSAKEANGIVATEKTESTALTGKWKLTANLADPGDGKATWQPAEGKPGYAVFDGKGKLSGEVFTEYITYSVKDSTMLVFKTKDGVIQNYRYQLRKDTLQMSPAGPIMCREACGMRFIKVLDTIN